MTCYIIAVVISFILTLPLAYDGWKRAHDPNDPGPH